MYEYLDRPPQVGDIVEFINNAGYTRNKLGSLHKVTQISFGKLSGLVPQLKGMSTLFSSRFKVVQTKPGIEVQVGDTVFCTSNNTVTSTNWVVGNTYTIEEINLSNKYPSAKATISNWNSCDSFVVLCKAQPKEQPMQITDYIVDIANTTLADRLILRQVLLDNGQKVDSGMHTTGSNVYYMCTTWYCGSHVSGNNISLADFINKFKKQDKLRNLAFYKRSGEHWTKEEYRTIRTFINDKNFSDPGYTHIKYYFGDKDGDYYNWDRQEKEPNFKNCLQVAYEDVFPTINQASNPFKVGDRVRCISNPNSTRKIGDEFTVVNVDNDDVYYKDGFATYYKYFELVQPLCQHSVQETVESTNQPIKEQPMDKTTLKLLAVLMTALPTTENPKDATNSNYIGIITEGDNYIGYVYADSIKDLKSIAAKPENESRTIHTFKFQDSFQQAPRPVVKVTRATPPAEDVE